MQALFVTWTDIKELICLSFNYNSFRFNDVTTPFNWLFVSSNFLLTTIVLVLSTFAYGFLNQTR